MAEEKKLQTAWDNKKVNKVDEKDRSSEVSEVNKREEEEIQHEEVVHELIEESRVEEDYYFLLIVSSLITTLGLLVNSAAVVIGGMLLAPLLSPMLTLGLGVVTTNRESLFRSATAILKSTGVVISIAFVTSFLLGVENPENFEIAQRIKPSLPYMYIAILSGIGATYAWAKPKLSASLPGIAVVVALLPPLAVTGIGLSELNREIITGSFQLYLINLIGISASAAVVFSLLGFHTVKWIEKEEIVREGIEN